MARIDAFFKLMSEQKASDLHLSTNNPPMLRINGDLIRVDYPALKDEELKTMVYEIAPETKIKLFEENLDVDFGYEVPGVARYRANFFQQKYGISAVFRLIPSQVLTVDDLGLPPVLTRSLPSFAKERSHSGSRSNRLGKIHHSCRHDGLRQPPAARPHHYSGRPD